MLKKVLFSTTWGPFSEQFFNTSPVDVMNQRFSRGCDVFTLNAHLHTNFAHLIAQNIDTPSVFLEYPGKEDFLKEPVGMTLGVYNKSELSDLHSRVHRAIKTNRRMVSPYLP